MQVHELFTTKIYSFKLDLDLNRLVSKINTFSHKVEKQERSNMGGYQGHGFEDKELEKAIKESIPKKREDGLEIDDFELQTWVNINYPGCYNLPHEHICRGSFLSGVFYVRVPPNSGKLLLHDPRSYMQLKSEDMMYYNYGNHVMELHPEENELIFFPSWLIHEVEQNAADTNRYSISFNVLNVTYAYDNKNEH